MSDDEVLPLPQDRSVVRAYLGFLSDSPGEATDGRWILVLEDAENKPRVIHHLGPASPLPSAVEAAISCLHKADYEIGRGVVVRPWAFIWEIARNVTRAE